MAEDIGTSEKEKGLPEGATAPEVPPKTPGGSEPLRQSQSTLDAIAFCTNEMNEYRTWFRWNEFRWVFWQHVTIIAGVIATLAGVITFPIPESWSAWAPFLHSLAWVRGVPAGIATIAASLIGSFSFREDAVRHETTRNALNCELIKYRTGADPYNKDEKSDTSIFLNTICNIIEAEQRNWNEQIKTLHSTTKSSDFVSAASSSIAATQPTGRLMVSAPAAPLRAPAPIADVRPRSPCYGEP
jgi:hypothetical protein